MFIKDSFKVINKENGMSYDVFIQDYQYLMSGKICKRYNVGINGHLEWNFLYYLDSYKELAEMFTFPQPLTKEQIL